MVKKHDESDDARWFEQIRSMPADGRTPEGKPLDPDPWLDGPQPGGYPDPFGSPPPPDPFSAQDDPPADSGSDRPAGWNDRPGGGSSEGAEDRWLPRPPGSAAVPMPAYRPSDAPAPLPTHRPPDDPAPMPTVPQPADRPPLPSEPGEPADGRGGAPGPDAPSSGIAAEPAQETAPATSLEQPSDPWAPGYDIPRLAGDATQARADSAPQQVPEDGAVGWPGQQPAPAPPAPAHAAPPPAHEARTPAHAAPPSAQQAPLPAHAAPPPAHRAPLVNQAPPAQHAPPAHEVSAGPQHGYPAAPPPASGAGTPVPHGPGAALPSEPPRGPVQPPAIVPLDLDQAALVRQRKEAPQNGWRRAVYKASFGGINPGISREQSERNALVERIRTPIRGCHKIAVVSLKGGIGKTTTTSCLGLTLAHYRGDRVVALDANPDAGTLAERLTGVTDVSVRDLLENLEQVQSFTDISRYMSLANRLQVLASDQDAEVSEAFDAEQYTQVTALLSRYYNVILTDSGTGMLHSAMRGTLEAADSLVVVGAPSVDGSSRAAKTLDWLVAHGYGHLVSSAVAVISSVREKSDSVDMEVLRNHFGARCRAVIEIPYDPHLVIGGRIDMTQIRPQTERAYLELAAAVADGFREDR